MNLPVIDMHCDLLSYLEAVELADPFKKEDIGCNLSSLKDGHVKIQVMAIYSSTESGSSDLGIKQAEIFKNLSVQSKNFISPIKTPLELDEFSASKKTAMIAAIENASCFCEENEPLQNGFKKLEQIIEDTGRIIYIGLTHHGENRFGGGNTTKIGLKEDGKSLLNYLHGKKIALDFSHTSDALAYDLLDYLTRNNLDIPILASHSNFRSVFDHPRNLPDDIAKEIIKRNGVIGINFLRAFLNNDDPDTIYKHILHGIELGGNEAVCFGADYFFTGNHPDQSRRPFFFKEHENAGCYPAILENLSKKTSAEQVEKIAHKNALAFVKRVLADN